MAISGSSSFNESSPAEVLAVQKSSPIAISTLVILVTVAAGCVARSFADEEMLNLPGVASVLLVTLFATQFAITGRLAFLLILAIPAYFGSSPWNSPVRAHFGPETFPVYVFDLLVLSGGGIAVLEAVLSRATPTALFMRQQGAIVAVISVIAILKLIEVGISAESVRNAAVFYYFVATCLGLAYVHRHVDLKYAIPSLFLRSIPIAAIVPAVCLVGISLGGRELVLDSIGRQGLVTPAGILALAPPGSLVLLSFLGAGFLVEDRVPLWSRAAIVVLLIYDFVTYWDRALWLAISFGIAVGWMVKKGWRSVLLVACVLAALMTTADTIRSSVAEGHNKSSEWRLLAWGVTVIGIADRPFWGHPYDKSVFGQVLQTSDSQTAIAASNIRLNEQARSPHNSYLTLLFFGGIVQGGAVIVFILGTLIGLGRELAWRIRVRSPSWLGEAVFRGGCACALYAGFNVVLESPVEAITFWILFFPAWLWLMSLRQERRTICSLPSARAHVQV